jgi:CubicO group peptidase (beta-lactamase class C family)
MSDGRLSRSRLARMHDVMVGHVQGGDVPGIVTLVSRRGEVHVDALGTLAAGGEGAPVQRDTIFRIASITKPIVAVAAMILVEECRLRLDGPVDDLLPELANRTVLKDVERPIDETVPANRPISLRDLLTMRMSFGFLLPFSDQRPIEQAMAARGLALGPALVTVEPDAWLASLGALPLMHQPGERWMYDTATDVLGVLVARASGQSLEAFLRQRIFEPLGMKDTAFHVPPEKIHRLPEFYASDYEHGGLALFDHARGGAWSRPPVFQSARGGLVSTADDLLAFGQMLLNKGRCGRERILSRPSVEAMTTNQITPEQQAASVTFLGDDRGWGLGMAVGIRRGSIASRPGRFGWDGGYGTSWAVDPAEDLVGILLTQRMWDSAGGPRIFHDFWTLAYAAIDD